jgi:hypothetical protein
MPSFRLFVQDVGAAGYSAVTDVVSSDHAEALRVVRKIRIDPPDWLLLPHSRRDLWPNRKGAVKAEALRLHRDELVKMSLAQ